MECDPRISASTSALLCSPKGSWLCCMFGILPSSFILTPTFDKHGATPFAAGGFSEVYEVTLGSRRVAVKVLTATRETINVVHRVSGPFPHIGGDIYVWRLAPRQRGYRVEVDPSRERPAICWCLAEASIFLNEIHNVSILHSCRYD